MSFRFNHMQVRQWLGLAPSAKLPIDMHGTFYVPDMYGAGSLGVLHVERGHVSPNGWRGKSSKHRVFACCRNCSRFLPVGRLHQHKC